MGAGESASADAVTLAEALGECISAMGWVLLTGGRPAGVAVPALWRDFFCSLVKGVENANDVEECCRLIEARLR